MKLFLTILGLGSRLTALVLLLAAGFVPGMRGQEQQRGQAQQPTVATVIVNAQVSDGSDGPLKKVSMRIAGDRITKIGVFKPAKGEQVIDAQGLVLAPGFIDIHNHSAEALDKDPLAETQISQGITTVILGPDGFSPWPIG
jgi:N-acyl-D-amino-acid deacylase